MFRKLTVLFLCVVPLANTSPLSSYFSKRDVLDYRKLSALTKDEDFEIVFLPAILPKREAYNKVGNKFEEVILQFKAFERPISINLKENHKLLSPNFKAFIHDGNNSILLPNTHKSCALLHKNQGIIASINYCEPTLISGFVFLDDAILEINPLLKHFRQHNVEKENLLDFDVDENIPHIIRKIPHKLNEVRNDILRDVQSEVFTLEVAIFFDESAYKIFAPYLSYDDEKIRDMLLAYLNGVQALYHHPTLEASLEIVIVRLDILKMQPADLHALNGESNQLLDSFCSYQKELNVEDDSDPNHWDMGLYISGLDFFTYDNRGYKDFGTMGLSTVGGVCYQKYSCVIAEFGTTDLIGKPYPTAGFTSIYVLAHEIGHNLGMHHDGVKNDCNADGFIMSASRGFSGETQWSKCSAEVMQKLSKKKCLYDNGKSQYDHSKFSELPGRFYTVKKQCEIFLTDKDAYAVENQEDICQNLMCKTPNMDGYYYAGPALDGTQCASEKLMHCYGGDCITSHLRTRPGKWGPWSDDGQCESGCLIKSRGYQIKRRICFGLNAEDMDGSCMGPSIVSVLCKDTKVCPERINVRDYASQKCKHFSNVLPDLDFKGVGLQSSHREVQYFPLLTKKETYSI